MSISQQIRYKQNRPPKPTNCIHCGIPITQNPRGGTRKYCMSCAHLKQIRNNNINRRKRNQQIVYLYIPTHVYESLIEVQKRHEFSCVKDTIAAIIVNFLVENQYLEAPRNE